MCYLPYTHEVPTIDKPLIFFVDDDQAIASTTTQILNAAGFNCLEFSNPLEALSAAESRQPDVLITDALMPGLSGMLSVRA